MHQSLITLTMPTSTFSVAILLLSNTEGMLWSTSPWESITKIHRVPWFFEPDTTDNDPALNYLWWTVAVVKMVKMFAENVWVLPELDQDKYIVVQKVDNNTAGHIAWIRFVKDSKISLAINKVINDVLTQHECNAYQVMAQHDTCTVSGILTNHNCLR